MRFRRRLPIFVGVLLIAAAVAVVVVLRKHAPPEAARLLPAADGYVYVNLRRFRHANLGSQLPAVSREPEYDQFIKATGFQFENDLDEAAFAIHYPGKQPGSPAEARFSEVFVGKIQGVKLREYLQKISASVDNYHSIDIYNIPLEGRTLRVAILGADTVAASNHGDPLIIRSMIDRSRKLASPFGGPPLLRRYYKYVPISNRYVPFASLGWAVFRINPAAQGPAAGPLGLSFLFSKPAVVVSSLRYLGAVRFRVEAFTDDEGEAQRVATQLNTFFSLFHASEATLGGQGPDPDIKQLFESLKVKQEGDRAVLTATIPPGFIHKVFTEPPAQAVPDLPKTEAAPTSRPQKGTSK